MVGGKTLSCKLSAKATASTAPAAPIKWPIIDLIEDTGKERAFSPKTCLTALGFHQVI